MENKIEKIWNKNFVCVVLTNLMLCMGHFAVNPLVASYTTHLGATPHVMGLLTGMFFGVSLAIRPVSGPLITKVDKRKLLIVVFALGTVANAGYAMFHSIPMFVFFRFINGVQYSFVGSLIMTLAGDNLPAEKMASGMGIYGIGGAFGQSLAPSIGNALLAFGTSRRDTDFGFTLVFAYAAIIMALAIIPSVILAPDRKSKSDNASIGAWYKNIVTARALPSTLVILFLIMGYALYSNYIVEFGKEQGIVSGISVFYLVMAGTLIISRPLSGMLTDKFGIPKVLLPGIIVFGASFLIVSSAKSLPVLLIGAAVAAIGYGATQPALQAMCIQSVQPLKRGVASNTMYVGMDLGFFLGPVIGSIIYEKTNYATMFRFSSLIILVGLICFFIILPGYKRSQAELTAGDK